MAWESITGNCVYIWKSKSVFNKFDSWEKRAEMTNVTFLVITVPAEGEALIAGATYRFRKLIEEKPKSQFGNKKP